MTDTQFTQIFDAQRTVIEQQQSIAQDAIEAQRSSFSAAADAVEASESLVEQQTAFVKNAMFASLDAVETNLPEEAGDFGELRELLDEQFDAATETQVQSLQAFVEIIEESGAAYDEFADSYAETVDSSFDAYLDAHEQVTANVGELTENVEAVAEEIDVTA